MAKNIKSRRASKPFFLAADIETSANVDKEWTYGNYVSMISLSYDVNEDNKVNLVFAVTEENWFIKWLDAISVAAGRSSAVVWFNNSAKFDNHYLLQLLPQYGFKSVLSSSFMKDKQFYALHPEHKGILQITIKYKNKLIYIKDLYPVAQKSVAYMGEYLGMPKLKDEGEKYYNRDYRVLSVKEQNEYKYYCQRDTRILYDFINSDYATHLKLNSQSTTAPALAFKNMSEYISEAETGKSSSKYLRQNYSLPIELWDPEVVTGGYTLAHPLNAGKLIKNVFAADINSSYPNQACKPLIYTIPFEEEPEVPEGETLIKFYHINITKAKLRDKKLPPILKLATILRNNKFEKLNNMYLTEVTKKEFPDGLYKKVFEEELEWFEKFYEMKYEIVKTYYFLAKPWLETYMRDKYSIRQTIKKKKVKTQQDIAEDSAAKLALNGSIGMFGKNMFTEEIIYQENLKLEKGQVVKLDADSNRVYFVVETVKAPVSVYDVYQGFWLNIDKKRVMSKTSYNFYINAQITMGGRCQLYSAIYQLREKFLYCDTDSIYSTIPLDNIEGVTINGNVLGAWKIEPSFKYGKFLKAKCYILSNQLIIDDQTYKNGECKITIAGFSKSNLEDKIDLEKFSFGFQVTSKTTKRTSKEIIFTKQTKIIKPTKTLF